MSPALVTVLAVLGILVAVTIAFEGRWGGAGEIALLGALGAVAAAGRVLTVGLPSVQPVTLVCIVAGAAFGVRAGLTVGPLAVLISNGFLGHGPWTPGQMVLWALAGLTGALFGRRLANRWLLAAVAAAWGLLFGWGMNLWSLAVFGPTVSWAALVASGARSVPFDTAGALGNALLALTVGPVLLRLLCRYSSRRRVSVAVDPSPSSASRDGSSPVAINDSTRVRSSRWLKGLRT